MTDPRPTRAEAVPDVVAPPPHHPRFPLLDGMRAIAVLAVVAVHVSATSPVGSGLGNRLLSHLDAGVALFFLISGFLLYRPFIAHRTGGPGAPRVPIYLRRRALRILPAYWLFLATIVVLPGIDISSAGSPLQFLTMTNTVFDPVSAFCDDCAAAHTWSLAVEVSFYVVLPIFVLVTERVIGKGSPAGWALRIGLVLLIGSAGGVLVQIMLNDTSSPLLVHATTLRFAPWFALGMGLAVVSVLGRLAAEPTRWIARHGGALWVAAALVYVAACLKLPPASILLTIGDKLTFIVAAGIAALLLLSPAIFNEGRGAIHSFLSWRPIAWLGLISYGIFLWHVAVIVALDSITDSWSFVPLLFATVAITVPIAAASYYLLERPLLRFKR